MRNCWNISTLRKSAHCVAMSLNFLQKLSFEFQEVSDGSLKSHLCFCSCLSVQAHPGCLLVSGHGRDSAGERVGSADVHAAQRDRGHVTLPRAGTSCAAGGLVWLSAPSLIGADVCKWTLHVTVQRIWSCDHQHCLPEPHQMYF